MAVQSALEENAGNGSDIDVDDISPEEGKKLNLALGSAFKALMEAKNLKRKQKSKFEMMADKALLHFRMRLLDLVEIYLKNNPQMEICLEILTFFYDLMPFALTSHQELGKRFEKIFVQLSQLKTFSLETVQNVTQKNLAETFGSLLDRTSREKLNIQLQNYFKNACIFIIYSSHILQQLSSDEDDEVLKIIENHLTEFIAKRNPVLQLTTFVKILSIQWPGNFKFAKMICDLGLNSDVRSLRRSQSLVMLREFFKNHSLFQHNNKKAGKYCSRVCEGLKSYVGALETVSQLELQELMSLILATRNVKEFTVTTDLTAAVQKFRPQHVLKGNPLNVYRTLCTIMKIDFVANENIDKINGNGQECENGQENGKSETKKRKKGKDAKEKKLKKIKQLEEASEGLDKNFSFV
jgi:DNA polymerase phi